jgi:hypothetical protein
MKRIAQVLLILSIIGIVTTGPALAGDVEPRDVEFIKSSSSTTVVEGGEAEAWASAGIVSRSDYEFVSRDTGSAVVVATAVDAPQAVGTVDGADYRFVAGDGSPGATCQIALVAAIHPSC